MSLRVRAATVADASAIAAIEADAAPDPWSAAQVRASLALATTYGWVLDPVEGHLLSQVVADEAEVLIVAVRRDRQRQGLASHLLTTATQAWNAAGVARAFLEVRVDNRPALALYRRHGWVDAGLRPRYYADGTDAAVLRWEAP